MEAIRSDPKAAKAVDDALNEASSSCHEVVATLICK
jgi:hypothetical protein